MFNTLFLVLLTTFYLSSFCLLFDTDSLELFHFVAINNVILLSRFIYLTSLPPSSHFKDEQPIN